MWQTFEQAVQRSRDLEQQLADPAVIADAVRYTQAAKEYGRVSKFAKPYLEFRTLSEDLARTETQAAHESDPEMVRLYEEELAGLRQRRQALEARLEDLLLVDPAEDFDNIIMEIRAGTGRD